MKRSTAVLLAALLGTAALFAVDTGEFDAVADFSVTLKILSRLDRDAASAYGLLDRFLVLDGTVGSITILDGNENSYLVDVELLSGEWIGMEEVRIYSCHVRFSGPQYADLFPARPPRNPPPGIITRNDHVLVVAVPLEIRQTASGESAWVLEGGHIRVLR